MHPSQVASIVRQHPEIRKARLVVDLDAGKDRMTLQVELVGRGAGDAQAISATIREVTKLRGGVAFMDAGTLPNDGKVVDDRRDHDRR